MFSQAQILVYARQILLTFGTALVTKGYLDDGTLQAIVGGIIAAAGAVWTWYANRPNGMIAKAASLPQVQAIVTDPATARDVPSAKVVPPGA